MSMPDTLRLNELRLNRLTSANALESPLSITMPEGTCNEHLATTEFVCRALTDAVGFEFPDGPIGHVWTVGPEGEPQWRPPTTATSNNQFEIVAGNNIVVEYNTPSSGQVTISSNATSFSNLVAGDNITIEYDTPEEGQIRISSTGGGSSSEMGWYHHPNTMNENFTVLQGYNLLVAGPFAVGTGYSLEVEPGGTLVVV